MSLYNYFYKCIFDIVFLFIFCLIGVNDIDIEN